MNTWVFLRGLTRESRHWGDFPAVFRRHLPEARILTPDLPGNGMRYGETSPDTIEEMVEHCRRHLVRPGMLASFHLLANSLGAMVAVAWAVRYPEEIRGCVLINTSLRPFSPFHHRLRPGSYLPILRFMAGIGSAEARERAIFRFTSQRAEPPAGVLGEWVSYHRECPVSSMNALRQLLAAARYRAPHARPDCPVLVLTGRGDALVNPLCSHRLARHWNVDFAEHPSAGHDLTFDDGEWVAAQVGRWLRRSHAP